ncbi:thiol-activated cytolysin family protein [Fusobacterium perfoetens]|uniref:thiol-activated cytolysin family protein n=1 Tax=Fusobacterium perfoetens TaxID=852 RepID=UPI000688E057|nr:thiol-activated cytolysin family protein [Fusobacterium perfoetens]MCI6153436.1 thiol-activated cytolysin family protein [Fusobacterium perfoetens]MDY3238421.1 thiol-activated cytolysin family protein [Fusobacterium perfoetens]
MTINEGIRSLNYDSKKVLAYNGETISQFIPKIGNFSTDKFIVTTRTKRNIEDKLFDISVVTSTLDRIYLGAILLANQRLMENLPTEVTCEKKSLSFRINNLNGLNSSEANVTIQNPTSSSVMGKINDIANLWLKKYSSTNKHSTILDYKESMLYSEAQMIAEFGLEAKNLINKLNINYENNDKKQIYLCRLKQIYFSATMDAPNQISNLISDNVTWEELQSKGVNNDNPPVYVSNIDFGRIVYIKFETTETSDKVKEAFSAVVRGNDISQNLDYTNIIKNSSFSLIVVGGTINETKGIGLESLEDMRVILSSGLIFSKDSPGFPISYTTTFLKNNELAITSTKTDYIEVKTEIFTSGEIILEHYGAYVVRFFIDWEEINYNEKGIKVITKKSWNENGFYKTAPFKTVIPLPANSSNINIKAEGATGLVWDPWRVSIDKKNLPLVNVRNVIISGTTLAQTGVVTPDR